MIKMFLDDTIKDFTIRVLNEFIDTDTEKTLEQLCEALSIDVDTIANILQNLLKENKIEAVYRICSPFGDKDGLKDFENFNDIPKMIEDETQDLPVKFNIGLTNIKVIFKLSTNKEIN